MSTLARLAVLRPLSVLVVAAVVVIFGLYVGSEMDLDLLPEVQSPTVMVTVKAGNRPALEMEARFGQRIEQKLFTVRGLKSVEQVVRSGQLITRVSLNWGVDVELALLEINQALANIVTQNDIDSFTVSRFDPSQMPVMVIGMRSKIEGVDLSEIRRLVRRQFVPEIEKRKGVAEVRVRGGAEKQIEVHVDENRMQSFGLTLAQVANKIDVANADIDVGTLIDNNRILRIQGKGRFTSVQEISQVIVKYMKDADNQNFAVKVADFAQVQVNDVRTTGLVRVDGQEGLSLSIYKEGGANIIRVSNEIKSILAELNARYPQFHFTVITDDALVVENAINEVKFAGFIGMLLAVAVLVLFLRSIAPILIVAITIPVSVFGAIGAMGIADFSFNLLTLGGLALGIGLLVDNSIVVVESIYRRRKDGDSRIDSAVNGVKAVGGAIASSTLTTCVVFLPVVFVDGLATAFVSGIAFTVVVSLLASLATATLLIPALAIWLLPDEQRQDVEVKSKTLQSWLGKLLDRPLLLIILWIILIGVAVVGLSRLGTNILPVTQAEQLVIKLQGPTGQNVATTSRMVELVEQVLSKAVSENYNAVLSEVGRLDADEQVLLDRQSEENSARILVRLAGPNSNTNAMINKLSPMIANLDQVKVEWQSNAAGLSSVLGLDDSDIVVEVTGQSLNLIQQAAESLQQQLSEIPALSNVRSSLQGAPQQLSLVIKPLAAAQSGVNLTQISAVVKASLQGFDATSLYRGGELTDVRLLIERPNQADASASKLDAGELEELHFYSDNGQKVRLGDVVEITSLSGNREITRRDQRRIVNISARVNDGFSLPEAKFAVQSVLGKNVYPWGVSAAIAGDEQARKNNLENFRWLGALALLLVYMVLTASFESLRHPLVVLSVIPVTVVGVACALIPLGQPLGIMAMLGFVILVGIAVNDAILLVHAARQQEALGDSPREALLTGLDIRLRPIIMTTATTVLALLPIAIGVDAENLQVSLALTIIGGVVASTFGSLTMVPCMYLLLSSNKASSRS